MQNKSIKLLSVLAVVLVFLQSILPGAAFAADKTEPAESEGKLSAELLSEFNEDELTSFIITFTEKPDVEKVAMEAAQQADATLSEANVKELQREAVVTELQRAAETSQAEVMQLLEAEAEQGNAEEIKPYYVANTVAVTATKEVAEKINNLDEVEKIVPNKEKYLHNKTNAERAALPTSPVWNVERVNAPDVWEKGYDGTGIVVATIDSGVDWTHPAIKQNYRGYNAATGEVNHTYNWYDITGDSSEPVDVVDHGTHVTGTIVGTNGEQGIGVAPGAEWIAVRAFDSNGRASDSDLLEAAEWVLNPTDANGVERPDLAPDIVNNSWGGGGGYEEFYRDIVKAWVAAGIVPIFSTGNDYNQTPGSVEAPANYPESIAVGAVDQNNELAPFSLLGPSPYGEIKPDVVAPGVNIYSSIPNGRYGTKLGTSMASPAVSGVVALMKQAHANLSVQEIQGIIRSSATPLTDDEYTSHPNNGYGYGLLDATAAMEQTLVEKEKSVQRISGYLRYDTAIEISKEGWDRADTVILVRGDDFADALTSVPLAFKEDAPILLTGSSKLYDKTLREIKRLKARNVVIIGGTGAISNSIQSTLQNEGLNVRRISGSSRTDTALLIAKEVNPSGSDQAFVVNGYDFPDALSVAPYAAKNGIPILVTQKDRIPAATTKALSDLNVGKTIVVGGASVVTNAVKNKLPQANRISGNDRYSTNTLLAQHFNPDVEKMYIATGRNFADSLAGAMLAAKNNTGILLVHDRVPASVTKFITEKDVKNLTIFGGKGAVSEEIREELLDLLN